MKVSEFQKAFAALDPEKSVVVQVCGEEGGAWNCFAEVNESPGGLIQLRIHHPDLKKLPDFEFDKMLEEECERVIDLFLEYDYDLAILLARRTIALPPAPDRT